MSSPTVLAGILRSTERNNKPRIQGTRVVFSGLDDDEDEEDDQVNSGRKVS